jgi:hypothetical protein
MALRSVDLSGDTLVRLPGLVIACRDDLAVAHDGSEGVSPEGWLPDRVSIGALTKTFPPELVDHVVDITPTRAPSRRPRQAAACGAAASVTNV